MRPLFLSRRARVMRALRPTLETLAGVLLGLAVLILGGLLS